MQWVRLETRTGAGKVFVFLSSREGIATVLAQTSWLPYRVPHEAVRPLDPRLADGSGEQGRGMSSSVSSYADPLAASSGARTHRDLERPLAAVPGGRR